MRRRDEEERHHVGGDAEVAVQVVRGVVGAQDRQLRQDAGGLPGMAAVEGLDSRPQDEQGDLLAQVRLGLADLAGGPVHGRGARRRLPGRAAPRARRRRAHRGRRRARRRMAPGAHRVRGGMGGDHGAHAAPAMAVCDGSPGFAKAARAILDAVP